MELKTLTLFLVLSCVVCLTECVRRNHTKRWRRQQCPAGTYSTASPSYLCCSLCPKGFYLEADCTVNLGHPKCAECERGTAYLDHENNERKCDLCRTCGNDADGMIKEKVCTPSSNTVCRCADGYYCDKGDECKVCYKCITCEFGVIHPCTLTNNTQCVTEAPRETPSVHVIIWPLVLFLIIIILVVGFLWHRKKLCFKSPEETQENSQYLLPGDPNLKAFIPQIAEILGCKVVRKVVRYNGVLSRATMDNIMDNHPRDSEEQAYKLLESWYETYGMNGAYKTLIETLNATNSRRLAQEVQALISKAQTNGEVENNGVE